MPRDIEEFLKMAAKRRQEQKQKAAGQPPAGQKPPVQRPPAQKPKPAAGQSPRIVRRLRPEDEIQVIGSSNSPPDMRQQTVGEHVRTHIDTSSLADHALHLGEEVGLADDKLDARLHQKFDHKVSSLKKESAAQAETTAVTERHTSRLANDLLDMLRTPKSIRQAVLIAEVLKRPDFDE
jgi:hypothetical protein